MESETGAGADSLLAFADAILARSAAKPVAPELEVRPSLTFGLADKQFAIPILCCREILRVGSITRIPEAPPHVRGVLNLRGRILPVLELRTRLGLPDAPVTTRSRVIVVEAHDRLFGLLVDRVSHIAKVPAPAIKPAGDEVLPAHADDVTGVAHMGAESILMLDADRLVLAPASPGRSEK